MREKISLNGDYMTRGEVGCTVVWIFDVTFFLYDNYNNYIFNNKSDKTKFEIYELQHVTSSGVE
jgi:hypothetical protein